MGVRRGARGFGPWWRRPGLRTLQCLPRDNPAAPAREVIVSTQLDLRQQYEHVSFDFLRYTFRARPARRRRGKPFLGFLPALNHKRAQTIRQRIAVWSLTSRTSQTLRGPCSPHERGSTWLVELLWPLLSQCLPACSPVPQPRAHSLGAPEIQNSATSLALSSPLLVAARCPSGSHRLGVVEGRCAAVRSAVRAG